LYGFSICALVLFSSEWNYPALGSQLARISFLLHLPLYKFLVFAPISFQIERCPQSFIFNAPGPSEANQSEAKQYGQSMGSGPRRGQVGLDGLARVVRGAGPHQKLIFVVSQLSACLSLTSHYSIVD